jgi:hypothetical protein
MPAFTFPQAFRRHIDHLGTFFCGFATKKPGQKNAREARTVFRGLTARRDKNRMS